MGFTCILRRGRLSALEWEDASMSCSGHLLRPVLSITGDDGLPFANPTIITAISVRGAGDTTTLAADVVDRNL